MADDKTAAERAADFPILHKAFRTGPFEELGGWAHAIPIEARDEIRELLRLADGLLAERAAVRRVAPDRAAALLAIRRNPDSAVDALDALIALGWGAPSVAPDRETLRAEAEKVLKPHRFRYQDRAAAKRLGIGEVESSGVPYWDAIDAVVDALGSGVHSVPADTTVLAEADGYRALIERIRERQKESRATIVVSGCHIRSEPYGDAYMTELLDWDRARAAESRKAAGA